MDNADLVEVPLEEDFPSSDEVVESPSNKEKGSKSAKNEKQKKYGWHRKFQTEWSVKLPWVEGILADDGILHMIWCRVCMACADKPCVIVPKCNLIFKHDGRRTEKKAILRYSVKAGKSYISLNCKHKQNLRLYAPYP